MIKRHAWFIGLIFVLLTAVACGPSSGNSDNNGEGMTTESGLQYIETEAGTGDLAGNGSLVSVHYRGTLEDGTEFDNSYDRGEPFQFVIGKGMVIPGWDEGIALMKKGQL